MVRRPKIGIVAGDTLQPRFLALFEPLRDVFDTCIYALHQERLINLHQTGMKLRMFENITDMPGFMRGLEEELASSDLIIGVETLALSHVPSRPRCPQVFSADVCGRQRVPAVLLRALRQYPGYSIRYL